MSAGVNAGPLIALGKLGLIHLLPTLYGVVAIAPRVFAEVVTAGVAVGATDALEARRAVLRRDLRLLASEDVLLTDAVAALPLDEGELETIQAALANPVDVVLLDDLLARQHATRLGLAVKGTVGVLVDAYRAGLLTLDELAAIFESIAARDDIWIAAGLLDHVLARLRGDVAGEQ